MASPSSPEFEKTQISPAVTAESAQGFYEEYGIFYQANAEIGSLRREMRGRAQRDKLFDAIKPIILKDPRLRAIAETFITEPPAFSYVLGSDPGNFFALTKEKNQDDRMCLYIWGESTVFEFCPTAHTGEIIGVGAANRMYHVPWPFLHNIRKLNEVRVEMEDGGM